MHSADSTPPPAPRSRGSGNHLRLLVFSLIPALVMLLAAEGATRVWFSPVSAIYTWPLPGERIGLLRHDDELFWSLRPDSKVVYHGVAVVTNGLGLRSPPVAEKTGGEFRVLSLGESTTFGIGVPGDRTYSSLLEEDLRQRFPERGISVVNAGVPAYSSFQSLRYLETRGLALEPDLVLLYHEVNDYLPSSVRDSSSTSIGITMTDRQLYDSRMQKARRFMMKYSALYRLVSYRLAEHRARSFKARQNGDPFGSIGMPPVGFEPRLFSIVDGRPHSADLDETNLGRRVSEPERLENLRRFAALCRERGIGLLVIHPAYRFTSRHECLLTRFCRDEGVALFDAYDSLYPPDHPEGLFLDSWHPTAEGHRLLAEDLAPFIARRFLDESQERGKAAP